MTVYDIAILGGGPAGYMAAIHGAQNGAKVAIIEADKLGGTCLNRGCIPTKAMVEAAALWSNTEKAKQFGFTFEKSMNFPELVSYKNKTVSMLCKGIEQLLGHNKIDIIKGKGEITGISATKEITLADGTIVSAKNIIIATGSKTFVPPIEGLLDTQPHTSDNILDLQELPKTLIIVGGGVIGLEIASIFNSLGTKVTVVEMMEQILPGMEEEIAQRLKIFLKKRGIAIETGAKITSANGLSGESVTLWYTQKDKVQQITGDYLMVATGRKANFSGVPQDLIGKELDVNEFLETKISGIYGAGDVIGKYQLAHVGYHEGIIAVENILGRKTKMDYTAIPGCIFTEPQVASAGKTTQQLQDEGINFKTFKFPYSALGKAVATSDIEGLVKILTDEEGKRVIGMHIVGRDATELIHHGVMAIKLAIELKDLTSLVFAHPTFSECLGEVYQMACGNYYHTINRQ